MVIPQKLSAKTRYGLYYHGNHGEGVKLVGLIVYENEEDNGHVHDWLNKHAPHIPKSTLTPDWTPTSIVDEMMSDNQGLFESEGGEPSEKLLSVLKEFMTLVREIPATHIGPYPELNPCGDSVDVVFRGMNQFLLMNLEEDGMVSTYSDTYDGMGESHKIHMTDILLSDMISVVCWDFKEII
jgi:hypothetical protein